MTYEFKLSLIKLSTVISYPLIFNLLNGMKLCISSILNQ